MRCWRGSRTRSTSTAIGTGWETLEQVRPGIRSEKVSLVTFVWVSLAPLLSDSFNISSSSFDRAGLRNKSMIGAGFCLELGDPISSFVPMWFSGHSFGVVRMLFTLFLSSEFNLCGSVCVVVDVVEIVVVDVVWMPPWDTKVI